MSTNAREEAIAGRIADLLKSSVPMVTDYRCAFHPDRPATAICERCAADLCSECAGIRNHQTICNRCLGTLDKVLGGTGAASLLVRVLTHPLTIALVLAVLLGIVFISAGRIHRKGLLGTVPASAVEAEEQFRLSILLRTRKASRIEEHGDALVEAGRTHEARQEFEHARNVYETLIRDTTNRWEENILMLARARLLEKMGEHSYAAGLYENMTALPGPDKTYPVMAWFALGGLYERTEPERAVEAYDNVLRNLYYVPDTLSRVFNIVGHGSGAYNYESRMRRLTRADLDFGTIEAETLLRMGRVLCSLGRYDQAQHRLAQARDEASGTKLERQAEQELKRIRAIMSRQHSPESSAEAATQPEERLTIKHFD
jgi:tetratricopeptide (TPR) repeat protein